MTDDVFISVSTKVIQLQARRLRMAAEDSGMEQILMFCQMLQASHHCRQSVLTLGFICVTLCFPFAPDFGAHS